MKEKSGPGLETFSLPEEISPQEILADSALEAQAERLFTVLREVDDLADRLTDEQFCALVHQAVTSCGFVDAVDAWFSLLAMTERKIGTLDLRDFMPKTQDVQN